VQPPQAGGWPVTQGWGGKLDEGEERAIHTAQRSWLALRH
jgi:hypothetical protein